MNLQTAHKITALYHNDKNVDQRTSQEAKKQTAQLLSSGGLNSAYVYTGTRSITGVDGLLCFRPNINKRVYAVVFVTPKDLYQIDYVQLVDNKAKVIKSAEDIFFEDLAQTYERMYDEYVNVEQDGFIRI